MKDNTDDLWRYLQDARAACVDAKRVAEQKRVDAQSAEARADAAMRLESQCIEALRLVLCGQAAIELTAVTDHKFFYKVKLAKDDRGTPFCFDRPNMNPKKSETVHVSEEQPKTKLGS